MTIDELRLGGYLKIGDAKSVMDRIFKIKVLTDTLEDASIRRIYIIPTFHPV